MGTQSFETQEDLDDSFDDAMEREEDKATLREEIKELQYEINSMTDQVRDKEIELADMEKT